MSYLSGVQNIHTVVSPVMRKECRRFWEFKHCFNACLLNCFLELFTSLPVVTSQCEYRAAISNSNILVTLPRDLYGWVLTQLHLLVKPQQLTSLSPRCLSQSSATAAVDSNTRCAQNVGNLFKDGSVLPISCRIGADVELQMHVKIPAWRCSQTPTTGKNISQRPPLCPHARAIGWPFAPGVAHHAIFGGFLLESSVSVIVPTVRQVKWNMARCATLLPTPPPHRGRRR